MSFKLHLILENVIFQILHTSVKRRKITFNSEMTKMAASVQDFS